MKQQEPALFHRPLLLIGLCAWIGLGVAIGSEEVREPARADGRVIGPVDPQKGCIKCHDEEVRRWEATTHGDAYDWLEDSDHADEILENLGLDEYAVEAARCQACHVTMYAELEGEELAGGWASSGARIARRRGGEREEGAGALGAETGGGWGVGRSTERLGGQ